MDKLLWSNLCKVLGKRGAHALACNVSDKVCKQTPFQVCVRTRRTFSGWARRLVRRQAQPESDHDYDSKRLACPGSRARSLRPHSFRFGSIDSAGRRWSAQNKPCPLNSDLARDVQCACRSML
ncbi:hypothetical protein D3871_26255 [Noviherbaspirillum saxi]|uniref:Uncharacterized protein n=1 Tax=Noviherbaspirillum saxi TaxID=2320863 RepID=A0A3A3FID1_9BURK|nr:hypothetical protein D3871_26255 [Noviherbaspirillum saxi]